MLLIYILSCKNPQKKNNNFTWTLGINGGHSLGAVFLFNARETVSLLMHSDDAFT